MRLVLLLLTLSLATPTFAQRAEVGKMVETLRLVENSKGRGRDGELSPWQTLHYVWRQHSTKPFWWAGSSKPEHRAEQKRVATQHVIWIMARLERLNAEATPRNIALIWCAGIGAFQRGTLSAAKRDYATRAGNIYGTLR